MTRQTATRTRRTATRDDFLNISGGILGQFGQRYTDFGHVYFGRPK